MPLLLSRAWLTFLLDIARFLFDSCSDEIYISNGCIYRFKGGNLLESQGPLFEACLVRRLLDYAGNSTLTNSHSPQASPFRLKSTWLFLLRRSRLWKLLGGCGGTTEYTRWTSQSAAAQPFLRSTNNTTPSA